MRRYFNTLTLVAALTLTAAIRLHAEGASIAVEVDKPGHAISPMLYGIFFEDINCSADGGIYAEMVRNRSFEDSDKPEWWEAVGNGRPAVELAWTPRSRSARRIPHSLKVKIGQPRQRAGGVANNGYWGMAVARAQTYELSLFARGGEGFNGPLASRWRAATGLSMRRQTLRLLSSRLEAATGSR